LKYEDWIELAADLMQQKGYVNTVMGLRVSHKVEFAE
jgi:hypothetical protein